MDPFEEFKFKPLTEGLGFHKKKNRNQEIDFENTNINTLSIDTIKSRGLDLLEDVETNPLRPPLPRAKVNLSLKTNPTGPEKNGAVEDILSTLNKNRRFNLEVEDQKNTAKSKTTVEPKETYFSFSAAFIDGMLILATSLLCMIIMLAVTQVDLISSLTQPDPFGWIYISTFALITSVTFIYLTINRIYLGWTPGEWAFDQRVGRPEDLNKASFSLKVVARSFLVIATGFVLIPVISAIFKKDVAGSLTGARIYKKV